MNQRIPDFPPEYDFLVHCCAAISRQDYKAALYSLKKGLGRNVEWFNQINGVELAKHLQVVIAALESHLRQVYGYEWEQRIDIPVKLKVLKVLRCSFCEKQEGEVAKVIAGPSSNICNECVGICNEILRDAIEAAGSGGVRA